MQAIILVLLILTGAFWWWGIERSSTLFSVQVRDGRIRRIRGRIPPRLLTEVTDIIERSHVARAEIRGVLRDGRPVLLFDGEMSPSTEQQMRNVIGQFSAAEMRGARKR